MLASWLFAAGVDPRREIPLAYLWTMLLLMGVVLGAGVLIMFLTKWVKRIGSQKTLGDDGISFRVLYERGELTEEEYQKIRARLGQKLRQDLNVPAPPSAAPNPPQTSNRLSAAEPSPTIGPAEESKPGDSDPSIKPA